MHYHGNPSRHSCRGHAVGFIRWSLKRVSRKRELFNDYVETLNRFRAYGSSRISQASVASQNSSPPSMARSTGRRSSPGRTTAESAANETPKATVIKLQRVKFIIVLPSMAGLLVATGGRIFSVADNPQTAMPLWPLTGDGSRRRGFAGLSSAAAHVAARCAKTPLESG